MSDIASKIRDMEEQAAAEKPRTNPAQPPTVFDLYFAAALTGVISRSAIGYYSDQHLAAQALGFANAALLLRRTK